jgi:type IV pilus assembly protein PilE
MQLNRFTLNKGYTRGFTLIESMIALALVAITLSLAIPSYRAYVIRANRTEAMESLIAAASCQERVYIINNAYDANACATTTGNGTYTIAITTSNGNQNFLASAAPVSAQTEDNCGTLSLSHTGAKTADGKSGTFAQTCWGGRTVASS